MILLLTLVLAMVLHIVLSWPWVVLAGLVAGIVKGKWGWMHGAFGVALSWALLLLWNYVNVPAATGASYDILAGLFGSQSQVMVVLVTLGLGFLLGMLGALAGTQVRYLIRPPQKKT